MDCSPQTPQSMGFSRQDYQSGLPCPPPGDLTEPQDQTRDSCISCITGTSLPTEPPGMPVKSLKCAHCTQVSFFFSFWKWHFDNNLHSSHQDGKEYSLVGLTPVSAHLYLSGSQKPGLGFKGCNLPQVKVKVLVTQLCPTLCHPMDCSSPVSSIHGILQARILEQVAMPSSRGSSQGLNPRIEPGSSALQADSLPSEPPGKPTLPQGALKKTINCNVISHSTC